jgi:flavin reductase (DIM6/NTAB) family NADH-FMN oxidoreductase RutF
MAELVEMDGGWEEVRPDDFRNVLGHFCSGVTVVTASAAGDLAGMTCQSFFSLSLRPPLVAFSPARTSRSYPVIRRAQSFCINVLTEDQKDLCHRFARTGADKWRDVAWTPTPSGNPILDGVLAWIDCRVEAEYETGDHFLTVGRVTALKAAQARPLLYFKGAFANLHPGEQIPEAALKRAGQG